MAVYSDITFDSIPLDVDSISPSRGQKTRKSVVGMTLIESSIIGMGAQQWELEVSGVIYGTTSNNLSTNRANLEALDNVTPYAFVDGIHNGNYYIRPKSLRFDDRSDDVGSRYAYSMTLIEE